MSIAGIRSIRGDIYQTLVAFRWVLNILSDSQCQSLEVDSAVLPVDDVVITKKDGSRICCQCKKNQPDFKDWTVADLADELDKAARLLAADASSSVCFYSRGSFGELAKLAEYAVGHELEESYRAGLKLEKTRVDVALAKVILNSKGLTTFEFLRRTRFEATSEIEQFQSELRERLQYGGVAVRVRRHRRKIHRGMQ